MFTLPSNFFVFLMWIAALLFLWSIFKLITFSRKKASVKRVSGEMETTIDAFLQKFHDFSSETEAQYRISFWFSMVSAALGFMVILYALVLASRSEAVNVDVQIVSAVVIEAVGALFYGYSRRIQKDYRSLTETMKNFLLIESIRDHNARDLLLAQFTLQLIGIPKTVNDIKKEYFDRGTN